MSLGAARLLTSQNSTAACNFAALVVSVKRLSRANTSESSTEQLSCKRPRESNPRRYWQGRFVFSLSMAEQSDSEELKLSLAGPGPKKKFYHWQSVNNVRRNLGLTKTRKQTGSSSSSSTMVPLMICFQRVFSLRRFPLIRAHTISVFESGWW